MNNKQLFKIKIIYNNNRKYVEKINKFKKTKFYKNNSNNY